MDVQPRELVEYVTSYGKSPFSEWLNTLRDIGARALIRKRLNRLRIGNFGDTQNLGNGIHELRIFYGPGYRVYFGLDGKDIVVLLCGGDKKSQKRDIKKAEKYWKDYRR